MGKKGKDREKGRRNKGTLRKRWQNGKEKKKERKGRKMEEN